MPGDARWIASVSASALGTAECLASGEEPVDRQLSAALADEAVGLADELATIGLPPPRFFEHAVPLSVRFDALAKVAEVSLTKALGRRQSDDAAAGITRRLVSLVAAFRQAVPDVVEALELRSGPLREQWEARGGGLLAALRQLTEADVVVESAEVILVHPVRGGGGRAYPLYNSLQFEALLANPLAELPEVARLGWLWAQLHFDLPKYQDPLGRDRLGVIGPPAVLPGVLAAAEEVELVRFDRPTLETALSSWRVGAIDPDTLLDWWATYQASSPPWEVALAALDRMVGAVSPDPDRPV